jgi:hypothetical protein
MRRSDETTHGIEHKGHKDHEDKSGFVFFVIFVSFVADAVARAV